MEFTDRLSFQEKLGYSFQNVDLLTEALTHSVNVYNSKFPRKNRNYDRLKFMGESVLKLVIAEYVLQTSQVSVDEGKLTIERTRLYNNDILKEIGKSVLHPNERKYLSVNSGNLKNRSFLLNYSDFVKSLVGAVFIDSGEKCGINSCFQVFCKHWKPYLSHSVYLKSLEECFETPDEIIQFWNAKMVLESPELTRLQQILEYGFKNPELLQQARTHRTFYDAIQNDSKYTYLPDYQRLEFLGDAVLQLVVSQFFYGKNYLSGTCLATETAKLTEKTKQTQIAEKLQLQEYVCMKIDVSWSGIDDIVESIIGGMYVDGGIGVVNKFIVGTWELQRGPDLYPESVLEKLASKLNHRFNADVFLTIARTHPSENPKTEGIFKILKSLGEHAIKLFATEYTIRHLPLHIENSAIIAHTTNNLCSESNLHEIANYLNLKDVVLTKDHQLNNYGAFVWPLIGAIIEDSQNREVAYHLFYRLWNKFLTPVRPLHDSFPSCHEDQIKLRMVLLDDSKLGAMEKVLGYTFHNKNLLQVAASYGKCLPCCSSKINGCDKLFAIGFRALSLEFSEDDIFQFILTHANLQSEKISKMQFPKKDENRMKFTTSYMDAVTAICLIGAVYVDTCSLQQFTTFVSTFKCLMMQKSKPLDDQQRLVANDFYSLLKYKIDNGRHMPDLFKGIEALTEFVGEAFNVDVKKPTVFSKTVQKKEGSTTVPDEPYIPESKNIQHNLEPQPSLDLHPKTDLDIVQSKLNYKFDDESILNGALTHPSATSDPKGKKTFERLKLKGDQVAMFFVTEYVIRKYQPLQKLAKLGTLNGSTSFLCSAPNRRKIANQLNLMDVVILPDYLKKKSNPTFKSFENFVWPMIGAVLEDSKDAQTTFNLVCRLWIKSLGLAPITRSLLDSFPSCHENQVKLRTAYVPECYLSETDFAEIESFLSYSFGNRNLIEQAMTSVECRSGFKLKVGCCDKLFAIGFRALTMQCSQDELQLFFLTITNLSPELFSKCFVLPPKKKFESKAYAQAFVGVCLIGAVYVDSSSVQGFSKCFTTIKYLQMKSELANCQEKSLEDKLFLLLKYKMDTGKHFPEAFKANATSSGSKPGGKTVQVAVVKPMVFSNGPMKKSKQQQSSKKDKQIHGKLQKLQENIESELQRKEQERLKLIEKQETKLQRTLRRQKKKLQKIEKKLRSQKPVASGNQHHNKQQKQFIRQKQQTKVQLQRNIQVNLESLEDLQRLRDIKDGNERKLELERQRKVRKLELQEYKREQKRLKHEQKNQNILQQKLKEDLIREQKIQDELECQRKTEEELEHQQKIQKELELQEQQKEQKRLKRERKKQNKLQRKIQDDLEHQQKIQEELEHKQKIREELERNIQQILEQQQKIQEAREREEYLECQRKNQKAREHLERQRQIQKEREKQEYLERQRKIQEERKRQEQIEYQRKRQELIEQMERERHEQLERQRKMEEKRKLQEQLERRRIWQEERDRQERMEQIRKFREEEEDERQEELKRRKMQHDREQVRDFFVFLTIVVASVYLYNR